MVVWMLLMLAPTGNGSHIKGDVALRLERDWGSRRADGTYREDRDRLRIRLRLSWLYDLTDQLQFTTRLRSGSIERPQSPWVDPDEGRDAIEAHLDRYALRGERIDGKLTVWLGKYRLPFWMPSPFIWDSDMNQEGVAATYEGRFRLALGYYLINDPNRDTDYGDRARLWAGQAKTSRPIGEMTLSGAVAFLVARDQPGTENPAVADLDYDIVTGSVTLERAATTIAFEWIENTTDYPSTLHNGGEKSGSSFLLDHGSSEAVGHWRLSYRFASIEKYAVIADLAESGWHRWSSANGQTRGSNYQGHEFRAEVGLPRGLRLSWRIFAVRGLAFESPDAVSLETGKRTRLDLRYAF